MKILNKIIEDSMLVNGMLVDKQTDVKDKALNVINGWLSGEVSDNEVKDFSDEGDNKDLLYSGFYDNKTLSGDDLKYKEIELMDIIK